LGGKRTESAQRVGYNQPVEAQPKDADRFLAAFDEYKSKKA
jgi:hypothetical protein